ncbi:sperm head and tail associated protein-like [Hipposideros larvatus]
MNSSPFLKEFSAGPPSPLGKGQSNFPFLFGSQPPSGKGLNPFLTLELPLMPRKGYSDHPAHTSGPSPNPGKWCTDSSHLLGSPHFSRDPFSGLTGSAGISSITDTPGSLPGPTPPPPPQPPLRLARCSFEPCSLLLARHCCPEPVISGSSPPSPCFDGFRLQGSPPLHPRSPHCSGISPAGTPRPCPQSPYTDHHTYLCYCGENSSALVTSSVTSPPLTHRPPRTNPVVSSPLTHVYLETGPTISPVTHGCQGTGLMISPPVAHRALAISQISSLDPSWSSGRSYNDPPLSSASSPPTGQFYQGHLKPPDSCEPKPQLDQHLGKNCGAPLSSQACAADCPSSPQEDYQYSHLPPKTHISAPRSPYCVVLLPPGITGSSCSPQSQAPRKPCFESIVSWQAGGRSYLFSGTPVSGPLCPQETPLPLSSPCPFSAFSTPSPQGNTPQSPLCGSYNEPPLLTPVCPQEKSPKSPQLKQSRAPHRCRSLVTPAQNTPAEQSRPSKVSTCPTPPSHLSVLSGPSCMVTSITTCSNSCPKELPQGTTLPTLVPRTLKTVIPTSLPFCLPCDPILPSIYAQSCPHGPPLRAPCSTHIYSVVPPTPDPCPPSGSTGPPQCHNQPMVPPCGTYGTLRGPPQTYCQPVAPPCSTHIYSFIPLRTPFDPKSLPIAPRPQCHPGTMPCSLHVYSVASRASHKESLKIPYSCPVPSSMSSTCSTNPSCSSAVTSECQNSDNQNTNTHQSRSRSQSESPHHPSRIRSESKSLHFSRSRIQSDSLHQSINQDQCESLQLGVYQGQSESPQLSKSQGPSKSALHSESRSRSKSPHHDKSLGKRESPHHSRNQSKSPRHSRSHGRSKSPSHNKK